MKLEKNLAKFCKLSAPWMSGCFAGNAFTEGQRRLQHELEEHTDCGGDTMDNKKEMERAELHRAIWQIANDLRGSVDGWDFKQYVFGTLFYRTSRRR